MLEVGRIVPVYESLGGTTAWGAKLGSKWLRRVIWALFEELEKQGGSGLRPALRDAAKGGIPEPYGPVETLPKALIERLGFPGRLAASEGGAFS